MLVGVVAKYFSIEKPEPIPKVENNGMCLQGVYTGQFTLNENFAGGYKYELYTTSKGIEVWKTCTE